jgi:enoyl-CoA hydratase/carnithine racemase
MAEHIVTEIADGILGIRIDRADKKNALTFAMYTALADALEAADRNAAVRVVTISGVGDSFTSGNDLQDFLSGAPPEGEGPAFRFVRVISEVGKPIVAAVNGLAVGVGVTMLLHCDLVYAAANATFQIPFVNLGLVTEAASSLLLPRLMGHQKAAELLLLGERFDAAAAHAIGLVNAVCPGEALAGLARDRALALAAKPPSSVRLIKSLMKSKTASVPARMAEEGALFATQLRSAEAREAMTAFMERRKPDFSRFT